MDYKRLGRLEKNIQKTLNEFFEFELKKQLSSSVSISKVKVTPDFRNISVFVLKDPNESINKLFLDELKTLQELLQVYLFKALSLKKPVKVLFLFDTEMEENAYIESLFEKIK